MSAVTELGYFGLSISDVEIWKKFACEIVGMELVEEGGRLFLRMDDWHHRIALEVDGGDDLSYIGWRVASPEDLGTIAEKLAAANVDYRIGTREEAAERHVMGLLKTRDPGGNLTEIFWGPQIDRHKPFHPGRPMFGKFRTGDYGLGHILLARQPDTEAAVRFYSLLGFEGGVEYQLALADGSSMHPAFMRLNGRHHSIAFGLEASGKTINHAMVEYTELKDLGLALDLVRQRKIPLAMDLGMHANDEQLSFYPVNPSGWALELGWGGRDAVRQREHYRHDIFGHAPGSSEFGLGHEIASSR